MSAVRRNVADIRGSGAPFGAGVRIRPDFGAMFCEFF